jgi:hypothetical protein
LKLSDEAAVREELLVEPRIDLTKYAHEAQKAMFSLEKYISESGLDHKLIHLVKMKRSSDFMRSTHGVKLPFTLSRNAPR